MDLGIASKGLGKGCAVLCGVPAGYISGQNLLLDGGNYPGTF